MPVKCPLSERFWCKVDRGRADDCWEWTANRNEHGYGTIMSSRGAGRHRSLRAHRVAWELTHGTISDDQCVLHKCDNPGCVNPNHLFLGTMAQNTKDMVSKRRHSHGSRPSHAKLNEAAVADLIRLRDSGLTYQEVADRMGVSLVQAWRVYRGERWAHLPRESSQ